MSACAMLTFNNVTPEAWTCVQAAAAQYGITGADSGQQTANGFTVTWAYTLTTQTLQIQCTDSPIFVSCSIINSHIHDAVEKCLGDHQIEMAPMVPKA
jgi:hypothetical protein